MVNISPTTNKPRLTKPDCVAVKRFANHARTIVLYFDGDLQKAATVAQASAEKLHELMEAKIASRKKAKENKDDQDTDRSDV